VEGFLDVGQSEKSRFKKETSFFTRNQRMTVNGTVGKEAQQRISPNNSKAWGLNPTGTL
jgi:hypothetical protein